MRRIALVPHGDGLRDNEGASLLNSFRAAAESPPPTGSRNWARAGESMTTPFARPTFGIGVLLLAIALVACVLGVLSAFSREPVTFESLLTGWGALWCIPWLLILARRVQFRRLMPISIEVFLAGAPIVFIVSLPSALMSGWIGFIGVFVPLVFLLAWGGLMAGALRSGSLEETCDVFEGLSSMSDLDPGRTRSSAETGYRIHDPE